MLLARVILLVAFILAVYVDCLLAVLVVHFLAVLVGHFLPVFVGRVPTRCSCSRLHLISVGSLLLISVGSLLLISVSSLLLISVSSLLAVFFGHLLAVFVSRLFVFVSRSTRCFSRLFFSSFFHSSRFSHCFNSFSFQTWFFWLTVSNHSLVFNRVRVAKSTVGFNYAVFLKYSQTTTFYAVGGRYCTETFFGGYCTFNVFFM